jgi:CheY-like chemotaxis protein
VIPNGKLALQSVATTPPDLILLDIMMPELDGYEVCAQLKTDPASAAIPIIFITALNEPLDKVKAFNLGGVDYITKPFQTEEVLARVRTHLHIHELQIQLETANTQLTARNAELQARNAELQEALNAIHTLSGLIPICAWCGNKIQNEKAMGESGHVHRIPLRSHLHARHLPRLPEEAKITLNRSQRMKRTTNGRFHRRGH